MLLPARPQDPSSTQPPVSTRGQILTPPPERSRDGHYERGSNGNTLEARRYGVVRAHHLRRLPRRGEEGGRGRAERPGLGRPGAGRVRSGGRGLRVQPQGRSARDELPVQARHGQVHARREGRGGRVNASKTPRTVHGYGIDQPEPPRDAVSAAIRRERVAKSLCTKGRVCSGADLTCK